MCFLRLKLQNLLILLLLLFVNCKEDGCDVVPEVKVLIEARLLNPPFDELRAIGNSIEVPASYSVYNHGYNNNGVFVYRASDDEFYAFDRTCTLGHTPSVAVSLAVGETVRATCPECGSEYILSSGGIPTDDSQSKCALKQYQVVFYTNSEELRVYN